LDAVRSSSKPERAAGAYSLRLWVALFLGLALMFALDVPVMGALKPLHNSSVAHTLRHTIRWLGIGYVQATVLLILILVYVPMLITCLMTGGTWRWPRVMTASAWALLALATSGVAVSILKVLVHRPRPWVTLPPPHSWAEYMRLHEFQSFPSGESTTSFAVAVALSAWFPTLRYPLLILALIVACARVVVGNHHPSDAWGGAMLGIAVATWAVQLARRVGQGSPGGKQKRAA